MVSYPPQVLTALSRTEQPSITPASTRSDHPNKPLNNYDRNRHHNREKERRHLPPNIPHTPKQPKRQVHLPHPSREPRPYEAPSTEHCNLQAHDKCNPKMLTEIIPQLIPEFRPETRNPIGGIAGEGMQTRREQLGAAGGTAVVAGSRCVPLAHAMRHSSLKTCPHGSFTGPSFPS